jgi:endonuclease/exonuclease/phosphatase family metal-dependent hydrolase
VGVLSRFPLTQLDAGALTDPDWQVQVFRVEAESQTFLLYNVHLQVSNALAYLEEGDSVAADVAASVKSREAQARRLMADIATRSEAVIVAGDFNCTDQSGAYSILADTLSDAHQAAGWGFGHTFPAYGGSWHGIPIVPRQMRLDMIFYSDDFVALSSSVGSAHGESDHLPVLAEIAWRT